MKNVILIALLAIFSTYAMAQKEEDKNEKKVNAPAAVVKAFQKNYPKVTKVSWVAEENYYEAEFKLNGVENGATYDKNGQRIETEYEIKKEQLPANALNYIKKNFGTYKIAEVSKVTDSKNVITFETEINKGVKSLDLIFDAKGNFLKEEK